MCKFSLLIVVLLVLSLGAIAQETKNSDWKFSGASQIRPELDGRDFCNKTYPLTFTSMRTRFGVEKSLWDIVTFFAQFQDSRIFGEPGNSVKSLKNTDLHQGYVILHNIFDLPISAQAGRFEMSYGTTRLFGTNSWNYISRSFDGLRFSLNTDPLKLDVFSLTHTASTNYLSPTPTTYKYPAVNDNSQSIYGFYASLPNFAEGNTIDVTAFYDFNGNKTDAVNNDLERFTTGISYFLNIQDFSAIAEFDYQFGKFRGFDISAYLALLTLQYKFEPLTISANLDVLSGTEISENEKFNSFDPSYGTKHNYNGFMDYFSNTLVSTYGLGLNDYYLRFIFKMKDSPLSIQLDGHYFTTNQKSANDLNDLGQEIDLVVKYNIVKSATIEWGGSAFLPGDLMKVFWNIGLTDNDYIREDAAFWSYVMLRVDL